MHRVGKYNTNRKVPRLLRVVFKDKFERIKVVRNMQATLRKQRYFILKCYITKGMKAEEREEYQEQVKKAKELVEKRKIKESLRG